MSDAVDRLAQALRDVIKETVEEAVVHQSPSRDIPHARSHASGDLVDEETRQEYEARFGEPAPRAWGERRLISVAEAREWLGGISPSTLYALVKEGELPLVKIGRRSFILVQDLDNFLRKKRDDASGRT